MPVGKQERFNILGACFNVWKAFLIVKDRQTVMVEPHASYNALIRINEEHALTVDLDEPVIVAQIPFERDKTSFMLIDGAHRNYRALKEGKSLKAWILSPEETLKIMEGNPTLKKKLRKFL